MKKIKNHLTRRKCINEKKSLKKFTEFKKEVKYGKNEKVKSLLKFMKEKSQAKSLENERKLTKKQ